MHDARCGPLAARCQLPSSRMRPPCMRPPRMQPPRLRSPCMRPPCMQPSRMRPPFAHEKPLPLAGSDGLRSLQCALLALPFSLFSVLPGHSVGPSHRTSSGVRLVGSNDPKPSEPASGSGFSRANVLWFDPRAPELQERSKFRWGTGENARQPDADDKLPDC